jgi:hypothetical protein
VGPLLAERRGPRALYEPRRVRHSAVIVRGNSIDLAVVVLPLPRPLRLLRLVTLLSVLNRYAGAGMRGGSQCMSEGRPR